MADEAQTTMTRWAAFSGVVVMVIFALRVVPGLYWFDAGDFVTASTVMGVPHPTGFPVYTMLGHIASLLPIGNIATRVAFLSACCAGLATAVGVQLVAWTVQHTANSSDTNTDSLAAASAIAAARGAAIALPATWLGVLTLSINAAVPEVYTFNVLLAALALAGLAYRELHLDERGLLVACLALGFGLAHHALFGLLAPAILLTQLASKSRPAPRVAVAGLALLIIPGLAYLALMVRAEAGAVHAWGDPHSLPLLWDHMTGSSIREAFGSQQGVTGQSLALARELFTQIGPLIPAVVVGAGGWALAAQRSRVALAALVVVAVDVAYSTFINPMGTVDAQNGQLLAFFGVLGLFAAIASRTSASAASAAASAPPSDAPVAMSPDSTAPALFASSPWPARISIGMALAVVALAALAPRQRTANDQSLGDLMVLHLGSADPDSVSMSVTDGMSAGLLYAELALDMRPDHVVVLRNTLSDAVWAQHLNGVGPFEFVPPNVLHAWFETGRFTLDATTFDARVVDVLSHLIDSHTIYWEPLMTNSELPAGLSLVPGFPLHRIAESGALGRSVVDTSWTLLLVPADSHSPLASSGCDESPCLNWVSSWITFRGAEALRADNLQTAHQAFEMALSMSPTLATRWTNAAVGRAATGDLEGALQAVTQALAIDPESRTALRNGVRYAEATGDPRAADWRRRLGVIDAGALETRAME